MVDAQALQIEQDRVIEQMRRQLQNMSWKEINKTATEQRIVDTQLRRVQRATQNAAKTTIHDRMDAWKGVRMVKYKSIFGGNVNILTKRGSVTIDSSIYNRDSSRYRSERTKMMQSYYGTSRSFVLRWLQAGTDDRTAGSKYSSKGGRGNRGRITARDFMSTARNEMQVAADNVVRQLAVIEEKAFFKD
jgi:hypothetical protein